MNRIASFGLQLFCIPFILVLATKTTVAQKRGLVLTQQQALEDFHWLRFALEYTHPRLYKYDDKKTVDARFDSIGRSIKHSIHAIDFLALISKLNATVHCGHLYTIPQGLLESAVLQKKVLPFYVKIIDKRLYLLHNCSEASIAEGSEILSINGKSNTEIYKAILPGIAADGNIETRKLQLMQRYFFYTFQGFDLYFQLYVYRGDKFTIEYQEHNTNKKKTVTVEGITISERQKELLKRYNIDEQEWFKTPSPSFKIDEKNNLAVLTISRSFCDTKVDPNFDSLLSSAFGIIKQRQIKNLVLDIRGNEGGSESQQIALMSYLYNKPFRLYQNIFISHLDYRPLKPVIIERDTAQLLFNNDDEYMRRINDNLWINNYEYSDNLQLKEPQKNVFTGTLYVLINGTCFSSAADLASDLKRTTNAIFIGEESGGTFEGPTGGDDIVIQLPNSKIMVRISPNLQIGFLYQKHPLGRGVLPAYPIKYDINDVLQQKDLEMELARTLIKSNP